MISKLGEKWDFDTKATYITPQSDTGEALKYPNRLMFNSNKNWKLGLDWKNPTTLRNRKTFWDTEKALTTLWIHQRDAKMPWMVHHSRESTKERQLREEETMGINSYEIISPNVTSVLYGKHKYIASKHPSEHRKMNNETLIFGLSNLYKF